MKQSRVDIRKILADSKRREELMVGVIVATQAREGRDITREQARAVYLKIQKERENE